MAWLTATEIDRRFAPPPTPCPAQAEAIARLHEGARLYAHAILLHTPACGDQSAAVRLLGQVLDTAVAAVRTSGPKVLGDWLSRLESAQRGPNAYLSAYLEPLPGAGTAGRVA